MDKRKALAAVAFSVPATFAAKAQDGTRRFSGIAYAGGVITDHGWFDRVAFDLSSTKFATPAPALFQHDAPIGVVDKANVNGQIVVEGNIFADVDGPAKNVADMADRGMPWQLSVYIKPGSIEEFKAGAKIKLNGQTFDGPLTVFRNNRVREVSFCALGADDQTSATVFNIGGDEPRQAGDTMTGFTQEDIDRAVKTAVDAEKANTTSEKARADALQTQFTASRNATRTEALKTYFTARGKEWKEEVAKPYLDMTDEQFAAVTAEFASHKPPLDPKLAAEQAKSGVSTEAAGSVDDIRAKARQYIAEQAKVGNTVSVSDAVTFVTRKAA